MVVWLQEAKKAQILIYSLRFTFLTRVAKITKTTVDFKSS